MSERRAIQIRIARLLTFAPVTRSTRRTRRGLPCTPSRETMGAAQSSRSKHWQRASVARYSPHPMRPKDQSNDCYP